MEKPPENPPSAEDEPQPETAETPRLEREAPVSGERIPPPFQERTGTEAQGPDEVAEETVAEAPPAPTWPGSASIGAAAPLSLRCPYCDIPLSSLDVAGYRVYQCERCGYQKQILTRDLRSP